LVKNNRDKKKEREKKKYHNINMKENGACHCFILIYLYKKKKNFAYNNVSIPNQILGSPRIYKQINPMILASETLTTIITPCDIGYRNPNYNHNTKIEVTL